MVMQMTFNPSNIGSNPIGLNFCIQYRFVCANKIQKKLKVYTIVVEVWLHTVHNIFIFTRLQFNGKTPVFQTDFVSSSLTNRKRVFGLQVVLLILRISKLRNLSTRQQLKKNFFQLQGQRTAYCVLRTAYCVLRTAYCVLRTVAKVFILYFIVII